MEMAQLVECWSVLLCDSYCIRSGGRELESGWHRTNCWVLIWMSAYDAYDSVYELEPNDVIKGYMSDQQKMLRCASVRVSSSPLKH